MLQTIADIPAPEGRLRIERVVADPPEDAPPGVIAPMVVSVAAWLDRALITCERAEELLSAFVTSERDDGTAYRVTISKRDGSLSTTPPLS
jgi:hypothetical protein